MRSSILRFSDCFREVTNQLMDSDSEWHGGGGGQQAAGARRCHKGLSHLSDGVREAWL